MVQRKVPNKLCIETDLHLKSENRLGNLSPSPRHQESKNKGTDLKKKMKKSRSIKRADFENLKSHTFIREVAQPGKPPPLYVSTPQKQSPNKGSDASPNYMKSTSSFDARKELSNNSRFGSSVSSHKSEKTITRTSSLKLVRTLTKSPSFKLARVTVKKCFCKNLEVQRATCSSTLKDSKFPTYLALSPGATESEGTSTTKVCPYTYCSLNGHRHAPLPPLKCFLMARRRMLKAQKSTKLGCLSPSQVKASGDGMKETVTEQITLHEKPADQEMDLHEDHADFFIEIYVGNTENEEEKEEIDFSVDEEGDEKVVERCSNEAPRSEIHSGQNIHNSSGDIINDCHRGETVVESLLRKTKDPETKQSLQQELIADAGDETDEDQEDAAKSQIRIPSVNLLRDLFEADQDVTKEDSNGIQYGAAAKEGELKQAFVGEDLHSNNDDELQNQSEKDHHGAHGFKISDSIDSEKQIHSGLNQVNIAENRFEDVNDMQVKNSTKLDPEETLSLSETAATAREKTAFIRCRRHPSEEMLKAPNNLKIIRCKRPVEELVEPREFNPRDPNYLPVEPNPEAEKVDLRHQMMDERKNAEEWMLDYALQQTVFKLAPARKRKVSLLVEAFEKVIPRPKYETHMRQITSF